MLLSLAFREPDYDKFLTQVTRRQFANWMALMQIQPFGDLRGDIQAAIVARAMAGGTLQDHMPLLEDDGESIEAIQAMYEE